MGEVASMEKQLGGMDCRRCMYRIEMASGVGVMVGGSSSSRRRGYVWLDERDMLWKG